MKSTLLKLVGAVSLVFAVIAPTANAANIDTGVNVFLVSGPGIAGSGIASSVTPNRNWYGGSRVPADPVLAGGNSWISAPGNTSGQSDHEPDGIYTYTTTVTLAPGETGSISGKLAVDNTIQLGLVGGALSALIPAAGIVGFAELYDFTVTGLVAGINTIQFLVTNATFGPTGLLITQSDITINAIPLPAAAWLFGSALLGLITVARRKAAV